MWNWVMEHPWWSASFLAVGVALVALVACIAWAIYDEWDSADLDRRVEKRREEHQRYARNRALSKLCKLALKRASRNTFEPICDHYIAGYKYHDGPDPDYDYGKSNIWEKVRVGSGIPITEANIMGYGIPPRKVYLCDGGSLKYFDDRRDFKALKEVPFCDLAYDERQDIVVRLTELAGERDFKSKQFIIGE